MLDLRRQFDDRSAGDAGRRGEAVGRDEGERDRRAERRRGGEMGGIGHGFSSSPAARRCAARRNTNAPLLAIFIKLGGNCPAVESAPAGLLAAMAVQDARASSRASCVNRSARRRRTRRAVAGYSSSRPMEQGAGDLQRRRRLPRHGRDRPSGLGDQRGLADQRDRAQDFLGGRPSSRFSSAIEPPVRI